MKNTTLNTLNKVAADAAKAFILDWQHGYTTPSKVKSDFTSLGNKQTGIEFIKKTIRVDKGIVSRIWMDRFNVKLSNILKTTQQFNYLANEILARVKRNAPESLKGLDVL